MNMISTLQCEKHFISDGYNILIGKNQRGRRTDLTYTILFAQLTPLFRIYDLACGSGEVTLFFDKLGKALTEAEKLPEDHIVTEATDPYTYKYVKNNNNIRTIYITILTFL